MKNVHSETHTELLKTEAQAKAEEARFEHMVREKEKELEKVLAEKLQKEEAIDQLRRELSGSRSANEQLEKLRNLSSETEKKSGVLEAKVKEVEAKIAALEKEKTELVDDKETLQGKLKFAMKNYRKLENQVSTLQHEVIELEARGVTDKGTGGDQKEPTQPAGGSEELMEAKEMIEELQVELESKEKKAADAVKRYCDLLKKHKKLQGEMKTGQLERLKLARHKSSSQNDFKPISPQASERGKSMMSLRSRKSDISTKSELPRRVTWRKAPACPAVRPKGRARRIAEIKPVSEKEEESCKVQ